MASVTVISPASIMASGGPEPEERVATKQRFSRGGLGALDLTVMGLSVVVMSIFVVLPLLALAYGALQDNSPTAGNTNWSLRAVQQVYGSTQYVGKIINTFEIALWVTAFALVIGTMMAWAVARTDTPYSGFFEMMFLAPMLMSPFVGATAWVALAAPESGFLNAIFWALFDGPAFNIFSKTGVILVMILYFTPYAYLFSIGSFRGMDPSLEEAARMTGASNVQTMRRITLPLVKPSIAAAGLLIFVLSSEMFSIPGLLGRPAGYTNLPYEIYLQIRRSPPDWPVAAALGTVLIWVALVGMYFYRRMTKASKRFVTISGKGFRPHRMNIGKLKYATLGLGLTYALLANILPYSALVLGSFLKYMPGRDLNLTHFTMDNYSYIGGRHFAQATRNTLILSIATPTMIVLLAVILAFIVLRTQIRGRGLIDTIATFPVAVPGIVFGIGVLWAYFLNPLPIYGTIFLIVFAYVGRYLPQGLRIASSALLQIHKDLEDSARIHGANTIETVRRITLPLLKAPMLYAWILVFMLVVREISAAIVLYGPGSLILSVLIWDLMDYGRVTTAYAVGLLLTLFVLIIVVIVRKFFGIDLTKRDAP